MRVYTKKVFFVVVGLLWIVTGCSSRDTFKISGDISDGREITLRMLVYSPSGVRPEVLAARSGHFEYEAPAASDHRKTFIEIYSNDYTLLGLLAVEGGDKEEVTVDPAGISGFRIQTATNETDTTSFNDMLNLWLSNTEKIDNESISEFISLYPYNAASYALLTTLYDASIDPLGAYELLSKIEPDARPGYYDNGFGFISYNRGVLPGNYKVLPDTLFCAADTFFILDPAKYKTMLLAFTAEGDQRADSVVPLLRYAGEYAKKDSVLALEYNLSPDTVTWRRALRNDRRKPLKTDEPKTDTKKSNKNKKNEPKSISDNPLNKNKVVDEEPINWVSVWTGTGVGTPGVDKYPVTGLPYYIVATPDTILYSGTSASSARDALPEQKQGKKKN
ncbi:MAG: hypothetical protein J1F20_02780 [Muribaculaceae bacterium]|nr:hypothetical protein [Muribaculaceae bacterium]